MEQEAFKTLAYDKIKVMLIGCASSNLGKKLAGERIVAEVGFACQLLQSVDLEGRLMTDSAAKQLLRSPQPWAHKGSRGCALVIGGSAWYYGAPLLAAEAVLRTGAGLCVGAAPAELVGTARGPGF